MITKLFYFYLFHFCSGVSKIIIQVYFYNRGDNIDLVILPSFGLGFSVLFMCYFFPCRETNLKFKLGLRVTDEQLQEERQLADFDGELGSHYKPSLFPETSNTFYHSNGLKRAQKPFFKKKKTLQLKF